MTALPHLDTTHQIPNRSALLWRAVFTGTNLFQLLVIGTLLEQLIFAELELNRWIWITLLSVLMFAVIKGQGWLVLLGLQLSLAVRIYGDYRFSFSELNFLYCCLALFTVAYACCFDQWGQVLSQNLADTITRKFRLSKDKPTTNQAAEKRVSQKYLTILEFTSCIVHFFVVCSSVLVALQLLDFLPVSRAGRSSWVRAALSDGGTVWPGPQVLFVLFVVLILIRHFGWRRMTRHQAGLYLRSEFVNYYFRDIQNMIVWINKKVRADAKKQETAFRRRSPEHSSE